MRGHDVSDRTIPLGGGGPHSGDCVLYWMQQSQRARWNHALEGALRAGATRRVPVYVLFVLAPGYPGANRRSLTFLLEGLRETARALRERGIGFVLRLGYPPAEVAALADEIRAGAVYVDAGHLRHQRRWREEAASLLDMPLLEVETDLVVPAWAVSDREEPAAWTLRRKIAPLLEGYMISPDEGDPVVDSTALGIMTEDPGEIEGLLERLGADPSAGALPGTRGGAEAGMLRWRRFLEERLDGYAELSREPGEDGTSGMSPWLHFGQVSALRMALEVREHGGPGAQAFLEQLVVRRELAFNMVRHRPDYDSWGVVPAWAKATLKARAGDRREALYGLEELEAGVTGDEYWNAAQRELVETGGMHGYMRMYWGKRVIDWSASPEEAFEHLGLLNDRWALDGRDPCSRAGIAWCFGKHDRPFGDHPVTGTLRRLGSDLPRMRRDRSSRYNRYLRRMGGATRGSSTAPDTERGGGAWKPHR